MTSRSLVRHLTVITPSHLYLAVVVVVVLVVVIRPARLRTVVYQAR